MIASGAFVDVSPSRDAQSETLDNRRIPCAENGCAHLVSHSPPRRPDLAPYCTVHRRLRVQGWLPTASRIPRPAGPIEIFPDRIAAAALVEGFTAIDACCVGITPALALALLERNLSNRALSQDRVNSYVRDMADGMWLINCQGIGFGTNGELYDGQHRLCAVVRSGKTVPMLVVRGLPLEARTTIDQGRVRSLPDVIRIFDREDNANRIVPWFRVIALLTNGRTTTVSYATTRQQRERYAATLKWFAAYGPRHRPFSRAAIVGALVYAHRVANEAVESFASRYASGANLPPGSPVLALRAYVSEGAQIDRDNARDMALKALRCLLAEMRGETLDRLSANDEAYRYFQRLHASLDLDSNPQSNGAEHVRRG